MEKAVQINKDKWYAKGKIFKIEIKYTNKEWMLNIILFKFINISLSINDFVKSLIKK